MKSGKGSNMSHKISNAVLLVSVCIVLLFAGCNPQTELSLKFNRDDAAVYKVSFEKSYSNKFDMPSTKPPKFSDELLQKQRVEVTFRQDIESVDDNGVAIAKITIKGLKILRVKDDVVKLN